MIDDTVKAYEDMGRCISVMVHESRIEMMRKDPIWRFLKLEDKPHWKHLNKFTQDAFLYPIEGIIGIAKISYQVKVWDERSPRGRSYIETSTWGIEMVGYIRMLPSADNYWMVSLGKEVD